MWWRAHPWLVPHVRGNIRNLSPYDVGSGLVTGDLYYVGLCSLYTQFAEKFHHERIWILSSAFSACLAVTMVLFFILLTWCVTWLVCECRAVLASLEGIPLGRGVGPFRRAAEFSLLVFRWGLTLTRNTGFWSSALVMVHPASVMPSSQSRRGSVPFPSTVRKS